MAHGPLVLVYQLFMNSFHTNSALTIFMQFCIRQSNAFFKLSHEVQEDCILSRCVWWWGGGGRGVGAVTRENFWAGCDAGTLNTSPIHI